MTDGGKTAAGHAQPRRQRCRKAWMPCLPGGRFHVITGAGMDRNTWTLPENLRWSFLHLADFLAASINRCRGIGVSGGKHRLASENFAGVVKQRRVDGFLQLGFGDPVGTRGLDDGLQRVDSFLQQNTGRGHVLRGGANQFQVMHVEYLSLALTFSNLDCNCLKFFVQEKRHRLGERSSNPGTGVPADPTQTIGADDAWVPPAFRCMGALPAIP
ncbi:hypothetical protein FQ154_13150 [Paeniglutamicibacter gangotriensis]|uniref:Uncharacterized protein n=1 Tax=Paeniglutamicibacter gangotriensis TaxID=254787 RepID=A0A5B0EAS1_9MICC|nr:hypothetical protein FQ154_13150 [Paeniglutamicibacter gangotriensis]